MYPWKAEVSALLAQQPRCHRQLLASSHGQKQVGCASGHVTAVSQSQWLHNWEVHAYVKGYQSWVGRCKTSAGQHNRYFISTAASMKNTPPTCWLDSQGAATQVLQCNAEWSSTGNATWLDNEGAGPHQWDHLCVNSLAVSMFTELFWSPDCLRVLALHLLVWERSAERLKSSYILIFMLIPS